MHLAFFRLVSAVHAIFYLPETIRLKIVGIYTLKSTTVRQQMRKSVLDLSHVRLSVELFIQKV